MKTLHLRRHSLKDGKNDTIGEKGLGFARSEGTRNIEGFDRAFHGPLVRTAQTLLAFVLDDGFDGVIMPVVFGLGDQATFDVMVNPAFKAAVESGKSNLAALDDAHPGDDVISWQKTAAAAIKGMFDQMEDGETAVGFFHSPTIELGVRELVGSYELVPGWDNLKEMDGLKIIQDGPSRYGIIEIIRAERPA